MQQLRRIPIEPRPRPIIRTRIRQQRPQTVQHHLIKPQNLNFIRHPQSSRYRIQFIVKHSLTAANLVGGLACDLYTVERK
jgi:hypothetical protein